MAKKQVSGGQGLRHNEGIVMITLLILYLIQSLNNYVRKKGIIFTMNAGLNGK